MPTWPTILIGSVWLISTVTFDPISAIRTYNEKRIAQLRQEVLEMFYHGYDNYLLHAYPFDELRPLSCDGMDTWGSYSLTLIDTLDTLAIMGNFSEFRRVAQLIIHNAQFDMNINVSVFETNIRILGGLLSAHLLSHKAGMELEKGWPCNGPLLRLAEKVARKLLPAFDTNTGMPYGTVNLRYGVPPNETPITCTAGVGTFIVEFGALSRLTGDPLYEKVALRALHSLYSKRSSIDLVGNHIDTESGKWTALDSGIGAGVDSYFEYLVKGAILFQKPELMHMFRVSFKAIEKHLGKGGWYVWATMGQGHVSTTTFQSLEAYWPGLLSLIGEFKTGMKAMTNYHRILKQYGGLPELYNIVQGRASHQREGYPLRPELVESAMYLYRATGDPYMLEIGEDILHSIQHSARTECGFATIRDVTTLTQEDRMESFFLAETVKYLYLLFDPTNFLLSEEDYEVIDHPHGKCTVYAGGYIFNTEAHPIDPSALNCCTGIRDEELHEEIANIDEIRTAPVFHGKVKPTKPKKNDILMNKQQTSQEKKTQSKDSEQKDENLTTGTGTATITKLSDDEVNENIQVTNSEGACKPDKDVMPEHHPDDLPKLLEPPRMLDDSSSVLEKLLKKLFEEQEAQNLKKVSLIETQVGEINQGPIDFSKPESIFISDNDMDQKIQSIVDKHTTNNRGKKEPIKSDIKSAPSPSTKEEQSNNRIKVRSNEESPDFDLIFSSHTTRSLSFYFSLKWLRNFPDLIRQLIPSERFDLQGFYARMSDQFTTEQFIKEFNLTSKWVHDYEVLKCPSVGIADRFMFFKPSLDD